VPSHFGSELARQILGLAERQSAETLTSVGRFGDSSEPLRVVFPSRFDGLSERDAHRLRGLRELFDMSRGPLEAELGVRLSLGETPAMGPGQRWLVGPAACTPELAELGLEPSSAPVVRRLREERVLVTDAPDAVGLFESLSLLRSFAWAAGDTLEARPCTSIEAALLRVAEEVAHTWPSFARRGISWIDLCLRHADALSSSSQPLDTLEEMVAQLEDAHTAVRRTDTVLPPHFRARVTDGELILHEVPEDSAAWRAGVREGYRLSGFDVASGWRRIGATPQHRPFAVAFRLLCGAERDEAEFTAVGPHGQLARWTESYRQREPESLVSWRSMPSGAGYLRIEQWPSSHRIDELIDAAFAEFQNCPGLVVDLRGNPGGSVSVAARFRDRFLRERTLLGAIQYTRCDGALTPAEELWAEPAATQRRWPRAVRFLTDGGTYSASEDALLGLQGLDHVEVLGMPSGGGSGRARSISLLPGWRLMVSSCLTFDRQGRCIEGDGITVDRSIAMGQRTHLAWSEELLAVADSGW